MLGAPDTLGLSQSPARIRPMPAGSGREQALAAAREFEAVFLADAFKAMQQGTGTEDPMNGTGSQNWRELLADEYARDMVRRGGIGLAEPIARELLRLQEEANQ